MTKGKKSGKEKPLIDFLYACVCVRARWRVDVFVSLCVWVHVPTSVHVCVNVYYVRVKAEVLSISFGATTAIDLHRSCWLSSLS